MTINTNQTNYITAGTWQRNKFIETASIGNKSDFTLSGLSGLITCKMFALSHDEQCVISRFTAL